LLARGVKVKKVDRRRCHLTAIEKFEIMKRLKPWGHTHIFLL
jgi:hypothetical protein